MGGLYFIGIIVGILFAFIYRKTLFRGDAVPFVMELPNYRMPGAKNVCQLLWEKAKDFLQKAFTVILIATMLIWFLQSFDIHFNMVTDSKDSMLAAISSIIVPVFKPLGLGDWRICTSLISGLMAKESVVSLPMEIVEAARIDGAGEFYTFNKIVLPIMKPALAVQAIFSFVASWNNYFIPALVLDTADKKTLPILIAQLRSADFLKFDMGKVYMMVAIAILPVIIVYLLLSKFIVRGVALGGVKG